MLIQMSLVGEAFPTAVDFAMVWLVSSVFIHVSFETTFFCEGLVANVTFERFLVCVSPHVDFKSLLLVIRLLASRVGAFKFILLFVSGEVLLETIVVCERLVADFALAAHCVLFIVVVFESHSSGEDFAAFDMITDKLMILGVKLLTSIRINLLTFFILS